MLRSNEQAQYLAGWSRRSLFQAYAQQSTGTTPARCRRRRRRRRRVQYVKNKNKTSAKSLVLFHKLVGSRVQSKSRHGHSLASFLCWRRLPRPLAPSGCLLLLLLRFLFCGPVFVLWLAQAQEACVAI